MEYKMNNIDAISREQFSESVARGKLRENCELQRANMSKDKHSSIFSRQRESIATRAVFKIGVILRSDNCISSFLIG